MSTWSVYKTAYANSSYHNLCALFIATDGETNDTTMLVYGNLQSGMDVQVLGHDNPHTIKGNIDKEHVRTTDDTRLQGVISVAKNTPVTWPQIDSLGLKFWQDGPYYKGEDWFNDIVKTLKDWRLLMA
jgi:hypothetical protein